MPSMDVYGTLMGHHEASMQIFSWTPAGNATDATAATAPTPRPHMASKAESYCTVQSLCYPGGAQPEGQTEPFYWFGVHTAHQNGPILK